MEEGERAPRYRWWVLGIGGAVLATAVVVVLWNRDGASVPGVEGRWRPESIAGYTIDPARTAANPREPLVEFRPDGTLTTSDGCNVVEIPYTVGEQGAFGHGAPGPQTDIGCWAVPNLGVVLKAKRVDVDGDVLTFLDGAGVEVGRYARAGG
ncbi:META domain-containing protein [Umezawaea tangerina]|uniref:META domain-containing protein n=1 Tax=Umezawaea tangerina TaxID=84725 RepID=UPI0011B232BE|nr:hypothetical protein [Umezawaea tangerina]